MISLSRGWLFVVGLALVAVLLLATRGFGAPGNIKGSVDVGPSGTTNPAVPYPGAATVPGAARTTTTEPGKPRSTRTSTSKKGTLEADGEQILPLAGGSGDLADHVGQKVTGRAVTVQSVDANEGFWIGTEGDRVWVQLVGPPPESPTHVTAGDRIDLTGTVVAHRAGFAGKVGVDASEGAASLTSQGAHIAVRKRAFSKVS